MTWIVRIVVLLLLGAAALQLYARWPRDFATAHGSVEMPGPGDGIWGHGAGAHISVSRDAAPETALAEIDAVIRSTPRTDVVAGGVEDGIVTYTTRTAFWGFPDLTTVEAVADGQGARLNIRAGLWIGKYDLGVNEARVVGWLQALGIPVPESRTGSP